MDFRKIDAGIDPNETNINEIEEMMNRANAELLKVMGESDFSKERVDKMFSILDRIRNIDREIAMNKGNDNYINSKLLERKNLLSKLKIMIEKGYDDVNEVDNGYRIVRIGNCVGLADENGDLIKSVYGESIFPFEYSDLSKVKGGNLLYMDKNGERGMENIKGKILYKSKLHCGNLFNCAILFDNGYAAVKVENGKYGLLNNKGELIDNVKYDYITNINGVEGIYKFLDKECWGLFDKDGNVIYKPKKCDDISDFREINGKKVAVAMKHVSSGQKRWLIGLNGDKAEELTKKKYVILEHERDEYYYFGEARPFGDIFGDKYGYVNCFTGEEYRGEKKKQLLEKRKSEGYEPKIDTLIHRMY